MTAAADLIAALPRQVNIGRRLMWWAPWKVTRPWLPRFSWHGSDEFCNDSVSLILPFAGALIVFWRRHLRTMPCGHCWDGMDAEQRAAYCAGGYLEGGRWHLDRFERWLGEAA
jgi:hypothetical protein